VASFQFDFATFKSQISCLGELSVRVCSSVRRRNASCLLQLGNQSRSPPACSGGHRPARRPNAPSTRCSRSPPASQQRPLRRARCTQHSAGIAAQRGAMRVLQPVMLHARRSICTMRTAPGTRGSMRDGRRLHEMLLGRPALAPRSGSRARGPDLGHAGMAAAGFIPFLESWLRGDDRDCSSVVRVLTDLFHGGSR
jgi:hypothetical protein